MQERCVLNRLMNCIVLTMLMLAVPLTARSEQADLETRIEALAQRLAQAGHIESPTAAHLRPRSFAGAAKRPPSAEAMEETAGPELSRWLDHLKLLVQIGRVEDAFDASEALIRAAQGAGRADYLAIAALYQAFLPAVSGDFPTAAKALADVIAVLDSEAGPAETFGARNWWVAAHARMLQAKLAAGQGLLNRATKYIQQGFRALPARSPATASMRQDLHLAYGHVLSYLSDVTGMLNQFEAALALAETTGRRFDGGAMLLALADTLIARDDPGLALALYRRLVEAAFRTGTERDLQRALFGLAKVAHAVGDPASSAAYVEEALGQDPPTRLALELQQLQAINMARLGRVADAERYLSKAETLAANEALSGRSGIAMLIRAEIAEADGRFREALALFRSYAEARRLNTREAFSEDVLALRAGLESELARERAELDLIQRERELAAERVKSQRIWLIAAAIILILAIAAILWLRRMAKQIDAARLHAEQASAAKSSFLAGMSHELRTPLNAVIGFSDMMAQEMVGPISDTYRGYSQAINRSGRHLLAVINDILDISRIEAGRSELEETTVRLPAVLREAVEMVEPRALDEGLEIVMEGVAAAPEVQADRRLIRQAVTNLLANAVKFTASGGRVILSVDRTIDGGLAITVEDTGEGMTEDELKTAMEPFGQVHSVLTRRHEGTGLGLPLVDNFMRMHGGYLALASDKGIGTRATLWLPASRVVEPAPEPLQLSA